MTHHNHGAGFHVYKYADGAACAGPRDPEKPGPYAPGVKAKDKQETPAAEYLFDISCANDCADLTATHADVSAIKGKTVQVLIDAAVTAVAAL